MIKEAIGSLVLGKSLTIEQSASVMDEIMEGKTTPAQIGAFLTALRVKGETAEEIAGLASVMRAKSTRIITDTPVLDIVGIGGDGINTFNISTAAAFVISGAGVKVAKHGNRAASSMCGSADVLEALGIKIDLPAEQVKTCIEQAGIGFMFAPVFHPAMKYVAPSRREIGIRTVFNILGPLTNPACAQYQLIGVPEISLGDKIISALSHMDIKHALVVHGLDGMDEMSISGDSVIWELKDNEIIKFRHALSPEDMGLKESPLESVKGGSAQENALTLRAVLSDEKGPKRDVVLLNAAAALMVADRVKTINEGISLAAKTIDSGLALAKLESLIKLSQSQAGG
ncbi:anthranilate phosphoribosyltransferase [Dehalococcoides mccartyi]|uniref:Anthranilate phosphoribosyltransferase n=1 Tax=Dehalococcoides mccartyi (strain VS) TaxID=311424 RepID=D2BJ55_DEHMV|nr:anthranilate phosphoribosyltransferase [Dehalococcoides mccartyi]ACZ62355.1 anthranilate phosphoribosyltransferase [Dehalococcoides mccartyi VS]